MTSQIAKQMLKLKGQYWQARRDVTDSQNEFRQQDRIRSTIIR